MTALPEAIYNHDDLEDADRLRTICSQFGESLSNLGLVAPAGLAVCYIGLYLPQVSIFNIVAAGVIGVSGLAAHVPILIGENDPTLCFQMLLKARRKYKTGWNVDQASRHLQLWQLKTYAKTCGAWLAAAGAIHLAGVGIDQLRHSPKPVWKAATAPLTLARPNPPASTPR